MRRLKKFVGVFTTTVVLAAGMAVAAPAATADSRCNTNNHTHGASFWKRTDHYVGKSTHDNMLLKRVQTMNQHTNSEPRAC